MQKIIEEIQTLMGSLSYYVDLEVQKKTQELNNQVESLTAKLETKETIIKDLQEHIRFVAQKGKSEKKEN